MWLAIIYICIQAAQVECDFLVSPALDSRTKCLQLLAEIEPLLNVDDRVLAFDRKCVQLDLA